MPLTAKGTDILKSMEKTYGSEKKAEQVLYASKNAGKITGIDALADAVSALCDDVKKLAPRVDAYCAARMDDHRVIGGAQIQPTAGQINNTLGLRFDKSNGGN